MQIKETKIVQGNREQNETNGVNAILFYKLTCTQ